MMTRSRPSLQSQMQLQPGALRLKKKKIRRDGMIKVLGEVIFAKIVNEDPR